jgi:hypothetical protein
MRDYCQPIVSIPIKSAWLPLVPTVTMTSSDPPLSNQQFRQIGVAFALERQVLMPELASALFDKERLAAGLLLAFSFLVGRTIADVKIEKIDRIQPAKRNQGTIDFKLVCRLSDRTVNLGICTLPFTDLELVGEACTRLLGYKDFGLDRLCLLRQSDLMTNVYQLPAHLPKLLSSDIGGHFVPLTSPEVVSLLTLLSVFQNKQQHELDTQQIFAYIDRKGLLATNKLIYNILTTARF